MQKGKQKKYVLERNLREVCRQGLANANSRLLQDVAEQLWYSDEVPKLTLVQPSFRRDAGYLVDKLSRFNVLGKARKLALIGAVRPFMQQQSQPVNKACRDPLALEWGASTDLTRRMKELMPLQTRHYARERQQQATETRVSEQTTT